MFTSNQNIVLKRLGSLLFSLIFLASLTHANKVKNLNINDGLADIDATCTLQDSDGFMWIGTGKGLQRYDGYELKSYYSDSLNFAMRINSIVLVNDIIWIYSKTGLQCFHVKREEFLTIQSDYDFKNKPIYIKNLSTLNNKLWLIIDKKLSICNYNLKNNIITLDVKIVQLPGISNDIQLNLVEYDYRGNIWLTSNSYIFQLHYVNNQFELITTHNFLRIKQIYYDSINLDLWVVSYRGIRKYSYANTNPLQLETENKIFLGERLKLGGNPLNAFKVINNKVWFGTVNSGLYKTSQLFPIAKIQEHYHIESGNISLNANGVYDITLSEDNCLWVALNNGGINIIDLNYKQFNAISNIYNAESNEIKTVKSISKIHEDKNGNLWIGTKNQGLFVVDKASKRLLPAEITSTGARKIANNILDIDGFGNNLFIVSPLGIIAYNTTTKTYFAYHIAKSSNFNFKENLTSVAVDNNRNIWLGYYDKAIQRVSFNNRGIVVTQKPIKEIKACAFDKITNLLYDSLQNELIVTDLKRIYKLKLNHNSDIVNAIPYKLAPNGRGLNESVSLWDTKKQNDSTYWIGSIGKGLLKVVLYDSVMNDGFGYNKCYSYLSNNLTYSNHIQSLLIQDSANVWFASNGISQFNTFSLNTRNFDSGDGLIGEGFMINTAHKSKNGTMYFGSTEGLVYFHPDSIYTNNVPPKLALSNVYINQKRIKRGIQTNGINTYNGTQLNLKHYQNNFTIEFSALHYANPGKNQYKYMLEGYDKNWIYTDGKVRRANYSNLKYGTYKFVVNGTNNDGVWSASPLTLNVKIITPLWHTKVAYLLYILILITIFLVIYKYNIRVLKLQHNLQHKEELHQTKLRFFTNISHELKTPLSLIYSPVEMLMNNPNIGKEQRLHFYRLIRKNINSVLQLVNEIMEFRKIETGKSELHLTKTNLNSFIENIVEMFREPMQKKNIDFTSTISKSNFNILIDTDKVSKIIYNLLSNAIKYTNSGGKVHIELRLNFNYNEQAFKYSYKIKNTKTANNNFFIIVRDSGLGISTESITQIFERYYQVNDTENGQHIGSGIGLALVKSLVLAHNGEIIVNSEKNKGTEFIIKLPSDAEFYKNIPKAALKTGQPGNALLNTDLLELQSTEEDYNEEYIKTYPFDKNKKTILIVEDNAELRNFIAKCLLTEYNILCANNGKTACLSLEKNIIHFIISDVAMPIMDGFKFTKYVKSNIEFCHIPVVLLTAKDSAEEKLEGVQTGADVYIAKPFSIEFLKETIANIFKQQNLLIEKYKKSYAIESSVITKNKTDKLFLEKVEKLVEQLMGEPDFKLDELYKAVGMSRSTFTNKVKLLTGLPPLELVKTIRLKKAAKLLTDSNSDISQIAYRVGFYNLSYFSKVFKDEFGCTPSEFSKQKHSFSK